MQIQITARQFHASDRLNDYVRSKVSRLEKFYDAIGSVHVIMSKSGAPETNTVEIRASVQRQNLVANAESHSLEEAIDEAVAVLKRQVKRYKEKRRGSDKTSVRMNEVD